MHLDPAASREIRGWILIALPASAFGWAKEAFRYQHLQDSQLRDRNTGAYCVAFPQGTMCSALDPQRIPNGFELRD